MIDELAVEVKEETAGAGEGGVDKRGRIAGGAGAAVGAKRDGGAAGVVGVGTVAAGVFLLGDHVAHAAIHRRPDEAAGEGSAGGFGDIEEGIAGSLDVVDVAAALDGEEVGEAGLFEEALADGGLGGGKILGADGIRKRKPDGKEPEELEDSG